jgi:hypothetical protein
MLVACGDNEPDACPNLARPTCSNGQPASVFDEFSTNAVGCGNQGTPSLTAPACSLGSGASVSCTGAGQADCQLSVTTINLLYQTTST